jgi:hypothetical protein
MSRTPVVTENAPKALSGIYSQAIVANGFVYCSGCVPMDAKTMKLIDGDIQAHTVRPKSAFVSLSLALALLPCHCPVSCSLICGWTAAAAAAAAARTTTTQMTRCVDGLLMNVVH